MFITLCGAAGVLVGASCLLVVTAIAGYWAVRLTLWALAWTVWGLVRAIHLLDARRTASLPRSR